MMVAYVWNLPSSEDEVYFEVQVIIRALLLKKLEEIKLSRLLLLAEGNDRSE